MFLYNNIREMKQYTLLQKSSHRIGIGRIGIESRNPFIKNQNIGGNCNFLEKKK